MSVKIRLARRGRTKAPYYRVVVADSQMKRDGRFIESIGIYQPLRAEPGLQVKIDAEAALKWLRVGAIPSDTVRSLLRREGVMKTFHEEKVAARRAKTEREG